MFTITLKLAMRFAPLSLWPYLFSGESDKIYRIYRIEF
jgi:hypothetical protein